MSQPQPQPLPVTDIDRAIAFYRGLIDVEVRHHNEDFALLTLGTQSLELWRTDDPTGMRRTGRIRVEDAESAYAHCELQQVPRTDFRRRGWGTWEFTVLDPDGNRLTIYSMVVT